MDLALLFLGLIGGGFLGYWIRGKVTFSYKKVDKPEKKDEIRRVIRR